MVATLYDQSLDAYLPHNWPAGFGVFRQDWSRVNQQFENMAKYLNQTPRRLALRPEERANHLSFAAVEHHGGPVGIRLLWGAGRASGDDKTA